MSERVDAHHHVFDRARFAQPWIDASRAAIARDFSVADLAPLATAAGITRTVLVQTVPHPDETPYLLDLATGEEFVAGVVGWCDLTAPDVADRIAALRSCPGGEALVGIRHLVHSEPDPGWFDAPDVRRGIAAVGSAGLAYDLLLTPSHWDAATRLVRDLDQVTFVLDHLGQPPVRPHDDLGPWSSFLAALAALPNVAVKVSGLVTEADWRHWTVDDLRPVVDRAWSMFGADRLMFGSDWPVCLLAAEYGEWVDAVEILTAGASPDELTALFGGTARRCYGLDTIGGHS